MATKVDHAQFITLLRQRFPHVAEAIDDSSSGLLHMEVAAFGRATIEAIREGDASAVRSHFVFVDEIYRIADAEVENALHVSYLEHIAFDGRKAKAIKAREMLTPRLAQAVKALEAYWQAFRRSANA
jgi:hypothetical protein